jgi:hypothetical protein
MPTQKEIADVLYMSERNARDVLRGLAKGLGYSPDDEWWKRANLDEILKAYILDLREKAAGRGGDDQVNLTKARAEESMINAATKRLEYNARLGQLVPADDAAMVITDWCGFANREYQQCVFRLVSEIQAAYSIKVDQSLVEKIVLSTTERIKGHAEYLGRDLVAGVDEVREAGSAADS